MSKKTSKQIKTEAICQSLSSILKRIFPRVKKDVFDIYEYSDEELFYYIRWNNTHIREYVNNNYEKSLKRIIKALDENMFCEEEQILVRHLLVVLAEDCLNRCSDIEQDKKTIVYNLFKKSHTFCEAVKQHAKYTPEILASVFFYAFRMLEQPIMEKVIDEYISQYSKRNFAYFEFVSSLDCKFTNCFMRLPLWSEITCHKYCELSEYIDLMVPKLKFKEHQCYRFLHTAQQGAEGLIALKPLTKKLQNHCYWVNTNELPKYIQFEFIYPNGKNGDILKYIFEEYGETKMKSGMIWEGKIEKKYIELFEIFYSSMPITISDDERYRNLFNYHIPTIIDERSKELTTKYAQNFKVFHEYQALTVANSKEQTRRRTEIYSQLILQGQTSPKWKSEAQLFSLVSSIYPDAIYQYRTDWLGMQSLDIFIPSLSVGIEYQGKQHYSPIEHFGGEEHFKQQQENDKRKKMLCNKNGVILIDWPYTEGITATNLTKFLSEAQSKKGKKANK